MNVLMLFLSKNKNAMMNKFKVGDVVCLNHSDVLLTIIEDSIQLGQENQYKVCWFNENGDFKTVVVPGQALRRETKEAPMNVNAS